MSSGGPAVPPPPGGDWSLYSYGAPSRAAALLFGVLFAISGVLHFIQIFKFGIARYSALLPWAALVYTAGFALREVSSYYVQDLGIYIAAVVLIYAAPPVYAAVNYIILGRILHYVPSKSPIHPGRVVTTFLALDIIVEVLTGQGAWRVAKFDEPDEVKIGLALIRTSLILQLVLYLTFLLLQVMVHRRCRRDGVKSDIFYRIMRTMFISNVLILIRSTYRTVDSFLGYSGYTETHEWCIYVFDALPMLVNTWMLNILHPSIFLPPSSKIYLGSDGVNERMGPGWTDKRNFAASFFDPFDLWGLFTGRDNTTRFWDEEEKHPIMSIDPLKFTDCRRPWWIKLIDPFDWVGIGMLYAKRRAQKHAIKNATVPEEQKV